MASGIELYLAAMEDIKLRLGKVREIVSGHSPLNDESLDGEVASLLLRKALEQIAFASLAAHKDAYSKVYDDAEHAWRAKTLLGRLRDIHPDFYPTPVARHAPRLAETQHHFEPVEGYLTQEEFGFLYDAASSVIHAWNPHKSEPRVVNFERSVAEWVERIEKLLALHMIKLFQDENVWLIQMDHPEDHRVYAFTASPVSHQDQPPAL